jgi:hypothetical protein
MPCGRCIPIAQPDFERISAVFYARILEHADAKKALFAHQRHPLDHLRERPDAGGLRLPELGPPEAAEHLEVLSHPAPLEVRAARARGP